jgi:hypothetical protein
VSTGAGAAGHAGNSVTWVDFDPYVSIAVTGRDSGNEDFVDVPVWLSARPIDWLRIYLRAGVIGPLSGFTDSWQGPMGAGCAIRFGRWEVGAEGVFPRLLGPLNSGRLRNAFAYVRVRVGT